MLERQLKDIGVTSVKLGRSSNRWCTCATKTCRLWLARPTLAQLQRCGPFKKLSNTWNTWLGTCTCTWLCVGWVFEVDFLFASDKAMYQNSDIYRYTKKSAADFSSSFSVARWILKFGVWQLQSLRSLKARWRWRSLCSWTILVARIPRIWLCHLHSRNWWTPSMHTWWQASFGILTLRRGTPAMMMLQRATCWCKMNQSVGLQTQFFGWHCLQTLSNVYVRKVVEM